MAAVTLGFDEIEDRLRILRRRINLYVGQQIAYLALTIVAVATGAMIWAALRGSATVFAVTFWLAVLAILLTVIAVPLLLMRRLRTVAQTAAVADARGQLQDRLATLLAMRTQPSPARFAPYLLTQTLALGRRWEARVISPQRVPKSLYVLLAALAFPTTTAVVLPPPPPAADLSPAAMPAAAAKESATPRLMDFGRGLPAPGGAGGPGDAAERAAGALPPRAAGDTGAPKAPSDEGVPMPAPDHATLAQQVQQMIRQAFHADALPFDRRGLLPQSDEHGKDGAQDVSDDRRGTGAADSRLAKAEADSGGRQHDGGGERGSAEKSSQDGKQTHASKPGEQGNSNQGADSAKGSGAGSGTSGGGLLVQKGTTGEPVAGGEPKTFKLTLTSFLRGSPAKPPADPPRPRARSAAAAGASPAQSPAVLSEHQFGDDLLRKIDIPPAYEDLVRRVYGPRPAS